MKQQALHTIIHATALRDAAGTRFSPGSMLIQGGRIAAVGDPSDLPTDLAGQVEVINRIGDLVIPQMVNAHTHLELTDIGAQPYDPTQGFVGWVKQVREAAPRGGDTLSQSAGRGAAMARQAGVFAVGDIASSAGLARVRHGHGLLGTTFVELFGLGGPFNQAALNALRQTDPRSVMSQAEQDAGSRVGWQPHAPYSAGRELYAEAATRGPLSTHLAETREEAEFVGSLAGPFMQYIKELGRWDDRFADAYGQGLSPVQWMRPHLVALDAERYAQRRRWLVAHCNYVDDDDIKLLAETSTSVAYCPIASEYFGHKDHRYRDMLAAGINVCLGTDSIVGTDPDDPQPLGLLSAMRRLYERDQTDPEALLKMATINGARALWLGDDARVATLQLGAPARFAAVPIDAASKIDPLIQALTRQDPVEAISFDSLD